MAAYANAGWQGVDIPPQRVGSAIGHMGYFRPAAVPLWDSMLDWFREHTAVRAG